MDAIPSREELKRAMGLCLRTLRQRVNISQEALAFDGDVDRTYVGKVERGQSIPSLEILFKLFSVLGITFVEFAMEYESCLYAGRKHKRPRNG